MAARRRPGQALPGAPYANLADERGPEAWGRELAMPKRTRARHFEAERGTSPRPWRRLRPFKSVELLGGGLGVTQTAIELVHAFRAETGCSPQAHIWVAMRSDGRHSPKARRYSNDTQGRGGEARRSFFADSTAASSAARKRDRSSRVCDAGPPVMRPASRRL